MLLLATDIEFIFGRESILHAGNELGNTPIGVFRRQRDRRTFARYSRLFRDLIRINVINWKAIACRPSVEEQTIPYIAAPQRNEPEQADAIDRLS